MLNGENLSKVTQRGLFCFLLAVLHPGSPWHRQLWAQEPSPASGASTIVAPSAQNQPPENSVVPPGAPVVTIVGLCENPRTDKTPDANCTTVITRAEFEKIIDAVQPSMRPRARREFALTYANALVMAHKAEQMGLDKGNKFEQQMRIARIEVLTRELKKELQIEASKTSDADIENYYHGNLPSFEQAEMERIYVLKSQDWPGPADKTPTEVEKRDQLRHSEEAMKAEAEKLRKRAVAGEDFSKLQAEAYQTAGIKAAPNPSLGKIRRISLPRDQVSVMDLKPGEVSPVIEAINGYFIYKIKAKETLTLEQTREEIKGILRSQRLQEETQSIEESAVSTLNENYFHRQGPPPAGNKPPAKPDGL
jgi:hypothetical protein